MTSYRVVHFLPDPYSGARVPIAAIVSEAAGIRIALAERLPCAACLGSQSTEAAMGFVLDSLADARTFDVLPVGAGPQAVLGPVVPIPAGVVDAAEWVQKHILPRGTTKGTSEPPHGFVDQPTDPAHTDNGPLDRESLRQPQGPTSGVAATFGRWPGDESDEEILAMLEELS